MSLKTMRPLLAGKVDAASSIKLAVNPFYSFIGKNGSVLQAKLRHAGCQIAADIQTDFDMRRSRLMLDLEGGNWKNQYS